MSADLGTLIAIVVVASQKTDTGDWSLTSVHGIHVTATFVSTL